MASGQIAQSVEHTPEKCGVASSILALATNQPLLQKGFFWFCRNGLMGHMTTSVAHQTDTSRFVITVDGEEAYFAEYADTAETRDFHHAVVHKGFKARACPNHSSRSPWRMNQPLKRVIASCSAVAGFIEKNPEYQHLLEN